MKGYFGIGKAKNNSDYIPRPGEVFLYEIDPINQEWETRIGDGKTPAKDLPTLIPLVSHDIYTRVEKLEQEIEKLKNERN